jgi:cell division protein FtsI/penicillin-binding protein 2
MAWSPKRYDVIFFLLAACLVGLGVRLGRMVHANAAPAEPEAAEVARRVAQLQARTRIRLPLAARPGSIFARGRVSPVLMAGSLQAPSCFVDPSLLDDRQLVEVCGRLGSILDRSPAEIHEIIRPRRDKQFVWIARHITAGQAEAIDDLNIRAVGIQYEWQREYPNHDLAGTTLGYCRNDGQPGGGLELAVGHLTQPRDGQRVLVGDAGRRGVWTVPEQTRRAQDGANVYLSLDANIQRYLQDAVQASTDQYAAQWGVGVVLNPWTGEILAMCSTPTFDPNQYGTASFDEMLNRTIASPYEPGSIFKPLIAAGAVQHGLARYDESIFCENGVYHASRGGRISDHGHQYGMLSLWDIVVESSNIGMAKLGETIGNRTLHAFVREWGFGEKTRLGLGGETAGIVRPVEKWDGYSLRRIPFGQEISCSALQLAMAYGAIANGGELLRPRIVQQVTDVEGRVVWTGRRKVVRRVLSPAVAGQTLQCLRDVVTRGTAKKISESSWSLWGKTGTAQVPGPQGYMDDAYTGSFVGGAPVDNPAVICLISIYRPDRQKGYYGGTVAAPYVKDVLEKTLSYLNIPPDLQDECSGDNPDAADGSDTARWEPTRQAAR